MLSSLMKDEDELAAVRTAAMEAVVHMTPPGDEHVIESLGDCLDGPGSDMHTRLAALQALRQVALPGNKRAIAIAGARLADNKEEVRCAAVDLVIELTEGRADENAIAIASFHMKSSEPRVRQAAIEVLKHLLLDVPVDLVIARLDTCGTWQERTAAAELLAYLAPHGDEEVVAALLSRLGHASYIVRQFATLALANVAHRGDMRVISASRRHLDDENKEVVSAAKLALIELKAVSVR